MLERYSLRAHQVILVARLKAGQQGESTVSVDDLIIGLLIDDQDKVPETVSGAISQPGKPRMVTPRGQPFFDPQTATDLLWKIENRMVRSNPVESNVDMPVSTDLAHVFEGVIRLADKLHQKEIQPLHLLAAVLKDQYSKGAELLRQSGITQEKVLEALKRQ